MKHWKYLKYLLRHKWAVFVECWHVGLVWRGITHDLSKFRPSEWFPYVERFYGVHPNAASTKLIFDVAWKSHYKRNSHHWEFWVMNIHGNGFEMAVLDVVEMVCDWRAMSKTVGKGNVVNWYFENQHKINLHHNTRKMVEGLLGVTEFSQ